MEAATFEEVAPQPGDRSDQRPDADLVGRVRLESTTQAPAARPPVSSALPPDAELTLEETVAVMSSPTHDTTDEPSREGTQERCNADSIGACSTATLLSPVGACVSSLAMTADARHKR